MVPSSPIVEFLTLNTLECDLVWKYGHCRYSRGHTGVRWTPKPNLWCSYEKGKLDSETDTYPGRRSCKDEGRNRDDVSTVKMKIEVGMMFLQAEEHQRSPANRQKLGERPGKDSCSWSFEGSNPVDTLTSDF